MSCTLHTNKSEPQAVHNHATMSGLNTPTYCMIPEFAGGEVHKSVWNLQEEILQVTGTALSIQKQKLHNSSDTPYIRYLKNLSANSSGKKTLYFNHRYTGLQNKTALSFDRSNETNFCNPHSRYKFYSSNMLCKLNKEFCHTLKDLRKLAETGLLTSPFSFNIRKAPDNLNWIPLS